MSSTVSMQVLQKTWAQGVITGDLRLSWIDYYRLSLVLILEFKLIMIEMMLLKLRR